MYYKSRRRLDNGFLCLAVDSLTGQLLEFTYGATGENILKNHRLHYIQPLALEAGGDVLVPPPGDAVRAHPELKPEIALSAGGLSVTVAYPCLWDGSSPRQVRAEYRVELLEGAAESRWSLEIACGKGERVDRVRFPCLNGVYLGDDWSANTLVYPYFAGIKVENPVEAFARPPVEVDWRWQEYKYTYGLGSLAQKLPSGAWGLDCAYSGPLSMKWLDYYGGEFGLYFASLDESFSACTLRAETLGPSCPGMNFAFTHPVELGPGDSWRAPACAAALHPGDWHCGADAYRVFHRGLLPGTAAQPDWFRKSPGLAAHYDFMYQNGGIVHRYRDIPRLLDEARELGLDHLLFAGWHRDGFDNGYPRYEANEALGTAEELREGLGRVREAGGHVSFYVNSRIVNLSFPENQDFARENGVLLKDGSIMEERAGDRDFAVQCIGSAPWREKLGEAVRRAGEYGADGVYLDQLAMARPGLCTNHAHGHGFGEWNRFYRQLLEELRTEHGEDFALLHEGCSDAYGPVCAGQLISTFAYHHRGAFPQLYRYAFPEQALIDMAYPRRGLAMRPVHVARASREMMDRAFVTGLYFWVYDLAEDNSFHNDPESLAYLKALLSLRRFWLERFGQGIFQDDQGVRGGPGISLGLYQAEDGVLLACANRTGRPAWAELEGEGWSAAEAFTPGNLPAGEEAALDMGSGRARVEAPDSPVSLLYIK